MQGSCFSLLALCALVALPISGCGRATAPTSPGLARSRPVASTAGLTAGAFGGPASTTTAQGARDVAPIAIITSPRPSEDIVAQLVSPAIIRFEASDADGPGPGVKSYRYLLIRDDDPLFVPALTDPDSLQRKFAPNFAGWTELKGTATDVTLSGLLPDRSYAFALTAFDRRKNYDAVFTLTRNVLFFVFVNLAGPGGATTSAP